MQPEPLRVISLVELGSIASETGLAGRGVCLDLACQGVFGERRALARKAASLGKCLSGFTRPSERFEQNATARERGERRARVARMAVGDRLQEADRLIGPSLFSGLVGAREQGFGSGGRFGANARRLARQAWRRRRFARDL